MSNNTQGYVTYKNSMLQCVKRHLAQAEKNIFSWFFFSQFNFVRNLVPNIWFQIQYKPICRHYELYHLLNKTGLFHGGHFDM